MDKKRKTGGTRGFGIFEMVPWDYAKFIKECLEEGVGEEGSGGGQWAERGTEGLVGCKTGLPLCLSEPCS